MCVLASLSFCAILALLVPDSVWRRNLKRPSLEEPLLKDDEPWPKARLVTAEPTSALSPNPPKGTACFQGVGHTAEGSITASAVGVWHDQQSAQCEGVNEEAIPMSAASASPLLSRILAEEGESRRSEPMDESLRYAATSSPITIPQSQSEATESPFGSWTDIEGDASDISDTLRT
ncbi:MAG: hypothetical protein SGPRY_012198 [Prymnesium sp.]